MVIMPSGEAQNTYLHEGAHKAATNIVVLDVNLLEEVIMTLLSDFQCTLTIVCIPQFWFFVLFSKFGG